jgi:hypothetical protein
MRQLLLFLLTLSQASADALAGAWEAFHTQAATQKWSLYTYGDDLTDAAPWADDSENPYTFAYFTEGQGVWFFADSATGGGLLVGDYHAQRISSIDVTVSADPVEIDAIDLAVRTIGPDGEAFYYSGVYEAEDLGDEPSWYPLRFPLDDWWYRYDGENFVPFVPDATFLSNITEVGIRIFPTQGVTENSYVGIDDFILTPTVEAPVTEPTHADGQFTLSFHPNPGLAATIETYSNANRTWQPVPGQSELTGPQIFTVTVSERSALFRIQADETLTLVPDS